MFGEAIENFKIISKHRDINLESNEKRRHGFVSEPSYH